MAAQQAQKEEMERRNKEMKNDFLSQILDQQARARRKHIWSHIYFNCEYSCNDETRKS